MTQPQPHQQLVPIGVSTGSSNSSLGGSGGGSVCKRNPLPSSPVAMTVSESSDPSSSSSSLSSTSIRIHHSTTTATDTGAAAAASGTNVEQPLQYDDNNNSISKTSSSNNNDDKHNHNITSNASDGERNQKMRNSSNGSKMNRNNNKLNRMMSFRRRLQQQLDLQDDENEDDNNKNAREEQRRPQQQQQQQQQQHRPSESGEDSSSWNDDTDEEEGGGVRQRRRVRKQQGQDGLDLDLDMMMTSEEFGKRQQQEELRNGLQEIKRMARSDTQCVMTWRCVSFFMVLASTAVITCLSYIFMQNAGERSLKTSLEFMARALDQGVQNNLQVTLDRIQELSDIISLQGTAATTTNSSAADPQQQQQQIFPFVTLNHFEYYAALPPPLPTTTAKGGGDSTVLIYSPFVDTTTAAQWKEYSANQPKTSITMTTTTKTQQQQQQQQREQLQLQRMDSNLKDVVAPLWQSSSSSPVLQSLFNMDLLSLPQLKRAYPSLVAAAAAAAATTDGSSRSSYVTGPLSLNFWNDSSSVTTTTTTSLPEEEPEMFLMYPIFARDNSTINNNNGSKKLVGMILAIFPWKQYLTVGTPSLQKKIRPEEQQLRTRQVNDTSTNRENAMYGVVQNSCGQAATYRMEGYNVTYMGDLHTITNEDGMHFFNHNKNGKNHHPTVTIHLGNIFHDKDQSFGENDCVYELLLYPSRDMENVYFAKSNAIWFTILMAVILLWIVWVFLGYDMFVKRKYRVISQAAARASAIVSSFFPSHFRHRLVEEQKQKLKEQRRQAKNKKEEWKSDSKHGAVTEVLKTEEGPAGEDVLVVDHYDPYSDILKNKPIADLFPDTTVMFADLAGFQEWSSVRDPSHIFILLETLYRSFDRGAKQRRVFKVETVGDCYVAVTGLPEPRHDHAVVMARFARECMDKCHSATKALLATLGPDTVDLTMRIGLHSGPVTAGVLRGDRCRFQLFGDTMNVASRVMTTGRAGSIHLSSYTAELLVAAGKQRWVAKREDKVVAKGKGEIDTYWLTNNSNRRRDQRSGHSNASVSSVQSQPNLDFSASELSDDNNEVELSETTLRLIDWNVGVIETLIKRVVAARIAKGGSAAQVSTAPEKKIRNGKNILDELKGVISFPNVNAKAISKGHADAAMISLGDNVREQLCEYVRSLASLHDNKNPFHNFQHASHVVMTLSKFLEQVVVQRNSAQPKDEDEVDSGDDDDDDSNGQREREQKLKCGLILSDPLTQLGCIFSALIFQVGHPGIPNSQVVEEDPAAALPYKGQCVTEQKAMLLAWDMFMEDKYSDLRRIMFANQVSSMRRFRQILVHSVLATDITDVDLQQWRQTRWENFVATQTTSSSQNMSEKHVHLKATLVLENLVQASCVSHAMRHWSLYQRKSEHLFAEDYHAFKLGRLNENPVDVWYEQQNNFFDNYVVPITKNLCDAGLLGPVGEEYVDHAITNSENWRAEGRTAVVAMAQKYAI